MAGSLPLALGGTFTSYFMPVLIGAFRTPPIHGHFNYVGCAGFDVLEDLSH